MNIQIALSDNDYVGEAIRTIQQQAKLRDLCVRFSGGKDSVVIKHLMDLAGVSYKCRFSRTSVDPIELLKFINTYHKDVIVENPRITMFNMIVKKGFPPTRICRYCCKEFKERNTCKQDGAVFTLTGVRKAESKKRSSRNMIETCQGDKGVEFFHPIINWTDEQVWKFINDERIPYCSLYDEGFDRIGCVGCPLTSSKNIKREFERWPQFEKAYLWAFDKMLEGRSFDKWKNKYDVMEWYIYGVKKKYEELDGQFSLFNEDYFGQFTRDDVDDFYIDVDGAKEILIK